MAWIKERTRAALTPDARAIEAVDRIGRIVGMVAYDCWTENAVTAHMAVEYPLVWRSLTVPAFSYPFEQCNRGVLVACIPSHNARSLGLALRFGFAAQHRIRDGWSVGDDMILLEMRREDCRYLRRNGWTR